MHVCTHFYIGESPATDWQGPSTRDHDTNPESLRSTCRRRTRGRRQLSPGPTWEEREARGEGGVEEKTETKEEEKKKGEKRGPGALTTRNEFCVHKALCIQKCISFHIPKKYARKLGNSYFFDKQNRKLLI